MQDLLNKIKSCKEIPTPEEAQVILNDISTKFNITMFGSSGKFKPSETFGRIWKFMMASACIGDSNVRVSANKTAIIFLAKVAPFYPKAVQQLFCEANTRPPHGEMHAYVFYVQAFTFITHDIDPIYMTSFLNEADAIQFFVSKEEESMSYIATCISQLRAIPKMWFKELLEEYTKIILEPDQKLNFSKPMQDIITEILRQCPSLTEDFINNLNKGNEILANDPLTEKYVFFTLPIISNLISCKIKLDKGDAHLYPFAKQALKVFQMGVSNKSLEDAAFVILSYPCKTYSVEIEKDTEEKNVYIATLCPGTTKVDEDEVVQARIYFKNYKNSSKYFLPIPVDDLTKIVNDYINRIVSNAPKEKDSILATDIGRIMEALANVGKITYSKNYSDAKDPEKKKVMLKKLSEEMKPFFQTFDDVLTKSYDNITISSLNAFASIVTCFILPGLKQDLIYLLREIFYMDPNDDAHRKSIFGVMTALGMDEVAELLSEHAYNDFLTMAIDATLNSIPVFYNDFVNVLIHFARRSGHEKVIEMLFDRLDPLDTYNLEKLLRTASIIGEDTNHIDSLYLMSCIYTAIETVTFNELSLEFITSAFRFLSLFDLTVIQGDDNTIPPILGDIPSLISQILIESTNFITGTQIKSKQTRFSTESLKLQITAMFRKSDIDPLKKNLGTRINIHQQLYYALRLYGSLPFVPGIAAYFSSVSDAIVQLFPVLSSKCFKRYFSLLVRADKLAVLKALTPHLNRNPNIDVAAQWLKTASDKVTWARVGPSPDFLNALFKPLKSIPHLDTTGKYVETSSILTYVRLAMNNNQYKQILFNELTEMAPKEKSAVEGDFEANNEEEESSSEGEGESGGKENGERYSNKEEQYKNFFLLIIKKDPDMANRISEEGNLKLPEALVDFREGVLQSMIKMVNTASKIYKTITKEMSIGTKFLQSKQINYNISKNLKAPIEDNIEDLYEPDFYVAQLEFNTVKIDDPNDKDMLVKKIKLLLHYFCNIGHKSGIMACLKYIYDYNIKNTGKEKLIDLKEFRFPQYFIEDIAKLSMNHVAESFEEFMDNYCDIKEDESDKLVIKKYFSKESKFVGMCCYPLRIDRVLDFKIKVEEDRDNYNMLTNLNMITKVLNSSAKDPWNSFKRNSHLFNSIIDNSIKAINSDNMEFFPDVVLLADAFYRNMPDKSSVMNRISNILEKARNIDQLPGLEIMIQLFKDVLPIKLDDENKTRNRINSKLNALKSINKHIEFLVTNILRKNVGMSPFEKAFFDDFYKCGTMYKYIDYLHCINLFYYDNYDQNFNKKFLDEFNNNLSKYKDLPYINKLYANILLQFLPKYDYDKNPKLLEPIKNIYITLKDKQSEPIYRIYSPVIPDLYVTSIKYDIMCEVETKKKLAKSKDKEQKDITHRNNIIAMVSPIVPTWEGIEVASKCIDKFMEVVSNDEVKDDFILGMEMQILTVLNDGTARVTYTTSKLISLGFYTAYRYLPAEGPNTFLKIIFTDFFQINERFLPYYAVVKDFLDNECPYTLRKYDTISQFLIDGGKESEKYKFIILRSLNPRKEEEAAMFARQVSQGDNKAVNLKIQKMNRKRHYQFPK